MTSSGVRRSELLGAISLATDLGLGQPVEHMLRATRIGMRLGARLGLEPDELATLYDVSLLTYVGCPVYGDQTSAVFGDDIEFRARSYSVDLAGWPGQWFLLQRAATTGAPATRLRRAGRAVAGRRMVEQLAGQCGAAAVLADRLGLGEGTQRGLECAYARWDGHGVPSDARGDAIPLATRISQVAEACEVFARTVGPDVAAELVAERSGTQFDPEVVDALRADVGGILDDGDGDPWDEVMAAEPANRAPLTEDELDAALEAIGDFCDLRCRWFVGHARGTADLVVAAARTWGLPAAEVQLLRRAALVHDVGRFGVPATIWDSPEPLGRTALERVRLHPYYVERMFARPEPLRRIGQLAATHHERMDGLGYHRGLAGAMIAAPARLLGAADAYHAMTQARPHRPALEPDDAARQLRADADSGRLDPAAVDAVLAAAGHVGGRTRAGGPGGLTARETEVLGLVAAGHPNKVVARTLGISPKTVGNHVEHIYTKLGVTSRAAATLRAMELGVVGADAGRPTPQS